MNNQIYISYAWKDSKSETGIKREELVDKICNTLIEKRYKLIRDKNELSIGDSIRDFMYQIGTGNYVIVVISDKYLKSEYCMFEATEIMKSKGFEQRIFPIVLDDADIYSKEGQFNYINYWRLQREKLQELIKSTFTDEKDSAMLSVIQKISEIADRIDDFIVFISDRISINPAINFDGFITQITEAIKADALRARGSKRILVAGTGNFNLPQEVYWCAKKLGEQIAKSDYNLLTGGWEGVDYVVAEAYSGVIETKGLRLSDKLLHIVPDHKQPVFRGGAIQYVKQGDNEWLECLRRADLVILLGGVGGTYETYHFAQQENIPVIPIVCTSGDAKRVYDELLQSWNPKLVGNISIEKFKSLNQFINTEETAQDVVNDVMQIADEIIFAKQTLNN